MADFGWYEVFGGSLIGFLFGFRWANTRFDIERKALCKIISDYSRELGRLYDGGAYQKEIEP